MRILVHEFVSGGGLAGRSVKPALAREGGAMLTALLEDLASLGEHQIVTTADQRFPLGAPPDVEVVTMNARGSGRRLDDLMTTVEAVWLIAPEIGGCLERLVARAERRVTLVLGSGAMAIRRASNKAQLPQRLARHGIHHPPTRVVRGGRDSRRAAEAVGFPLIVKPARGAGCTGVFVARTARELDRAIDASRRAATGSSVILQRFVSGVPASVSLLADGERAVPLAVNRQFLQGRFGLSYKGGRTPLDHQLAHRAIDAAVRSCRAVPGLRGYVGVDVVITKSDAVVIEINPRLTTAYLGARRALAGNIAALALDACLGSLPAPPPVQRSVRFDARGRITAEREIVHHASFRGTVTGRILPRTVPASSVSSHFLTRSS